MSQPCIIIITGLPGTGKTTLGKRLSENLAVPFFYKDLFTHAICLIALYGHHAS